MVFYLPTFNNLKIIDMEKLTKRNKLGWGLLALTIIIMLGSLSFLIGIKALLIISFISIIFTVSLAIAIHLIAEE